MCKNMAVSFVSGVVGLTVGIVCTKKRMQKINDAYVRGVADFYDERLTDKNKQIDSLHKKIQDYERLLRKSTGQTERLIAFINNEEKS